MDPCLSSMVPYLTKRPHMSVYDSPNPEFLADLRFTESYHHLKGNTQLLIISTELDMIVYSNLLYAAFKAKIVLVGSFILLVKVTWD